MQTEGSFFLDLPVREIFCATVSQAWGVASCNCLFVFSRCNTVRVSTAMGDTIIQEIGRRSDSYFYHIGDGYHYNFHSETWTTIYFKCNRTSCQGRALLRLDGGFEHTQFHNHSADLLYTEVQEARREIINQARSPNYVTFSEILATERRR